MTTSQQNVVNTKYIAKSGSQAETETSLIQEHINFLTWGSVKRMEKEIPNDQTFGQNFCERT